MTRRHDSGIIHDSDVIGSRPPLDLGPLFAHCAPEVAERALREAFVAPLRDAQTPTIPHTRPEAPAQFRHITDIEREELRAKIQEAILSDLITRARRRVNREKDPGITADDVVALARQQPEAQLLGDGQRALSWAGPWLATLARLGLLVEYRILGGTQTFMRRSTRPEAHGNRQAVYVHPTDHRAPAQQQGVA